MKTYEVSVSARFHGLFTVEANDEAEAEDIVNRRWATGEIDIAELTEMDECRVDCVGEVAN